MQFTALPNHITPQLNANVTFSLHDRFKLECLKHQVDMQDVLSELMRDWINWP